MLNRPKTYRIRRSRKVGVLGAGMMGAGIALVSAKAGMDVVLIDTTQEAADRGKAYSESFMDKGIKRKKGDARAERGDAGQDQRHHRP